MQNTFMHYAEKICVHGIEYDIHKYIYIYIWVCPGDCSLISVAIAVWSYDEDRVPGLRPGPISANKNMEIV